MYNNIATANVKRLLKVFYFIFIDIFTLACPFCDNKINGVAKDTVPMFTKEKEHTPLQVHTLTFPSCAFIQGTKLGKFSEIAKRMGCFFTTGTVELD